MARNMTLESPEVGETPKQQTQIPRNEVAQQAPSGTARKRDWLNQALLENSSTRPKTKVWNYLVSVGIQGGILFVMILLPLYFTDAIDLKQFTTTMLVAPPPPPPPPPPVAQAIVKAPKATVKLMQAGKLTAPTAIPKQVATLKEAEDIPDVGIGVTGGVPGGIPGGQSGGVIGGILSGTPKAYVPPAPSQMPKAPVRVGGRVMAPRVIFAPDPVYPSLAKQARIWGEVVIDAVIDTNGNVVEMQVLSGHPLLVPAAMAALRQWKYQPTILNDEPISLQLAVTIKFRLQ